MVNPTAVQTRVRIPDVAAIKAEMEQTRQAYHDLLGSLSDEALGQPCTESKWTVKENLYHVAASVDEAIPMMVANARKGKPMPGWLNSAFGNWLIYKLAVWKARKVTPGAMIALYDAGHEQALALLDVIQDGEWDLPTAYPDGRSLTMETVFHVPAEHFELHAGWVP